MILKSKLFSAASLSVLLALGLAGCGNADTVKTTETETSEQEEQNVVVALPAETQELYEAEPPTYTEELEQADATLSVETETMDAIEHTAASQADDTLDALTSDSQEVLAEIDERLDAAGATLAAIKPMQMSDVRSKDDVALVTESAFDQADFNRDGVLDRDEFANMTTVVVNSDGSQPVDTVADKASKMLNDVTGAAGNEITKPADAVVATAAIDDAFTEASGDDASLTKEELRKVFLARFEKADVNDNDQLEESERKSFALLSIDENDQ